MFLKFIVLLVFVSGTISMRDELERYTIIATATDGSPCLGGCSPTTKECVVNWLWTKKPCQLENKLAPIYYTSKAIDKASSVCLSNCGKFGYLYEWCITTADNKWDYCSSHVRGEVPSKSRTYVDSYTRDSLPCKTACVVPGHNKGYQCYLNVILWRYCARNAISRVPVLPPDYQIGNTKKSSCDAFLTNLVKEGFSANFSKFDSESVPDNYLLEVAETMEDAMKLSPDSGVFKDISSDGGSVKNYTMVNMIMEDGTRTLMPAVIRAFVTNNTIRFNEPLLDVRIMSERNRRRRQISSIDEAFFNWRIIGYELGGTDEDYNFVRQSPRLYDSWLQLQRAIGKWSSDTGGSVNMIVVVFYQDARKYMPEGIGASMTFYNPDGSLFVGCRDTIYWNK